MRKILEAIKLFTHDKLDWGYPDNNGMNEYDEFQPTYSCKYCDMNIIQDSTGAWFHLSTKSK